MTTGESDSSSSPGSNENDDSPSWSQQSQQKKLEVNNGNMSSQQQQQHTIAMRGFGPGGRVSAKRAEVETYVIQVANIAPQATKDQMMSLFGYIGKIEDLRLYPTMSV